MLLYVTLSGWRKSSRKRRTKLSPFQIGNLAPTLSAKYAEKDGPPAVQPSLPFLFLVT